MKVIKKIILTIISLFLFSILAYNIYNFININILKNKITTVLGYTTLEVVSGSMEPTIKIGDIVIINTNDKDYRENDIISFYDKKNSIITHRIIEIDESNYITRGDNNTTKDTEILTKDKIIGKYVTKIESGGAIIASFKSPLTMIMIFVIGILICIFCSLDDKGNVILSEEEKEYEEFREYLKNKESNKSIEDKKNSSKSIAKKDNKTTTAKVKANKSSDKKAGTTKKKPSTKKKDTNNKNNTNNKKSSSSTSKKKTTTTKKN